MRSDTFDTTPRPSMLRGMQAQKWSVAGALSELVDNSFGPGRGNAAKVVITYSPKARTITVLDNGQGMEAIGRLFQLGSAPVRAPGDIGNYGFGGSFAVLWLARQVNIWTLAGGAVQFDRVDWPIALTRDQFPQLSNRWVAASLTNTPAELLDEGHGTLIELHLAPERTFVLSNVQRDLAATYAPGARLGKELVWTTVGKNGETRNLGDPSIRFSDPAKTVSFDLVVEIGDQFHLPVQGVVGIIDELPFEKSSIAIGFGFRVIVRTKDCYVSPDKEQRYGGSGVTGWLDLGDGWQPFLSTTKDGFNDAPLWDLLMGYVFTEIRPLLEMAETSKIELVLEGIALDVQRQLGGLYKVRVAGKEKRQERRDLGGTGHGGDATGVHRDTPRPTPTDIPGDDTEGAGTDTPAIYIYQQDEQQMEGQLITADAVSGGILVAVNKDHPVIKEALKQRPVNRMMINLGVTREIAEAVSSSTDLRRRILSPDQLRHLETIDDGDTTTPSPKSSRVIHHWLMDVAKNDAA